MIRRVIISKAAQRGARKAPVHDEPLRGQREGERSIRLSRQWRAIYRVLADGNAEFIEIQEVSPHDYQAPCE